MAKVFKEASVTPVEILAGDSVEFTIRLVVGSAGTAERWRLIVDCPAYLGYDRPSRMDQEDGGYMSLWCSNPDVDYTERVWDMEIRDFPTRQKTSFKGMAARMMVLDFEGAMAEDEDLVIKWGWMRNGHAVGCKVATVVPVLDFENIADVRYFSDPESALPDFGHDFEGYTRPEPDEEVSLSWKILPREVERLRLIRGIDRARLVPYDRFYNVGVVRDPQDLVELEEDADWEQNEHGVFEFAKPAVQLASRALPLEATPLRADVFDGYNVYFGDMHTHSQYSNDCIEREKLLRSPGDLHAYARGVAGIDFHAVTDHHQPWDRAKNRIPAELWKKTMKAADGHNDPGEFVTFYGFEYRDQRGDTAVVLGEKVDYDLITQEHYRPVDRLWEGLEGADFITIPHFHNGGSLEEGDWISADDLQVEPVMEIYSCHGSYEGPPEEINERATPLIKGRRPDRNGRWFLRQGYRYGFCANSDGHKGVVGNNGLTAVLARELTRQSVLEAIRARRCYGTTNARIVLLFSLNGELMGSELPAADEAQIAIRVAAEAPIKAVDLFRNAELHRRWKPGKLDFEVQSTEPCDGPTNWYVRVIQQDDHMAYSSPVWVG